MAMHTDKSNELFADKSNELSAGAPTGIAILRGGRVVGVRVHGARALRRETWQVAVVDGTFGAAGGAPARLEIRGTRVAVVDGGSGYVLPPRVLFVSRATRAAQPVSRATRAAQPVSRATRAAQPVSRAPPPAWDELSPDAQRDVAEDVRAALRYDDYTRSTRTNLVRDPLVFVRHDRSTREGLDTAVSTYMWPAPVEVERVSLSVRGAPARVRVTATNAHGARVLDLAMLVDGTVSFDTAVVVKRLSLHKDAHVEMEDVTVDGRRTPWACEDYEDMAEQLRTARSGAPKKKPTKKNKESDEDPDVMDATVYLQDVLAQLPADVRAAEGAAHKADVRAAAGALRKRYDALAASCALLPASAASAEAARDEAAGKEYRARAEVAAVAAAAAREKAKARVAKMEVQATRDARAAAEARRYGITPPDPLYTKSEIAQARAVAEKQLSVPDEAQAIACARLESKYKRHSRRAEKYAKIALFVPFLKKRARREANRATRADDLYTTQCSLPLERER